jgi:hypothetical protein
MITRNGEPMESEAVKLLAKSSSASSGAELY